MFGYRLSYLPPSCFLLLCIVVYSTCGVAVASNIWIGGTGAADGKYVAQPNINAGNWVSAAHFINCNRVGTCSLVNAPPNMIIQFLGVQCGDACGGRGCPWMCVWPPPLSIYGMVTAVRGPALGTVTISFFPPNSTFSVSQSTAVGGANFEIVSMIFTNEFGDGDVSIPNDSVDCLQVGHSIRIDPSPTLFAVSNGDTASVPSLSVWATIMFTLLLLTFGTIFIVLGQSMTATAGVSLTQKPCLFDLNIFLKVLTLALVLVCIGFVSAIWYFGSIAPRDIIGTLISAGITTYLVHLWIASAKNSQ